LPQQLVAPLRRPSLLQARCLVQPLESSAQRQTMLEQMLLEQALLEQMLL
jgi:hypothetical protein